MEEYRDLHCSLLKETCSIIICDDVYRSLSTSRLCELHFFLQMIFPATGSLLNKRVELKEKRLAEGGT